MNSDPHGRDGKSRGARQSIEFVCGLLAEYGVELTAETLRQAKFDGPAAREPLLRGLHALALTAALGWPPGAVAGAARLRRQLAADGLDDAPLGPEARALVLHLLATWHCPPGLTARLATPQPSSRALLLALSWLIAAGRLFETTLQRAAVPSELMPLLPPLPQEPSCGPNAAAARAAAERAAAVRGAAAARAVNSALGWARVDAAANQVRATLGAVQTRSKLLGALLEGRERIVADLMQGDGPGARQQQQYGKAAPSNVLFVHQTAAASPYERLLATAPRLCEAHADAIDSAAPLLARQAECSRHAAVFLAWVGSVVREDSAAATTPATRGAARVTGQSVVGQRGGASSSGGESVQLAVGVTPAEVISLAAEFPGAVGPEAAQVLARVLGRLQQAAAAAGVGNNCSSSQPAAASAGLVDSLARCGLQQRGPGGGSSSAAGVGSSCGNVGVEQAAGSGLLQGLQPFADVAAVALSAVGETPLPDHRLLHLPHDLAGKCPGPFAGVTRAGSQQQQQQQQQQCLAGGADNSSSSTGTAAAAPMLWRVPVAATAVQRAAGRGGARHTGSKFDRPPGVGKAAADVTDAVADVERLQGLALTAAKRLAKARGGVKPRLSAAAARLFGSGSGIASREAPAACEGCLLIGGN